MKKGDIYESLLGGAEYVIKRIMNEKVLLQSKSGGRQIITEVETLKIKLFYQEKGGEG